MRVHDVGTLRLEVGKQFSPPPNPSPRWGEDRWGDERLLYPLSSVKEGAGARATDDTSPVSSPAVSPFPMAQWVADSPPPSYQDRFLNHKEGTGSAVSFPVTSGMLALPTGRLLPSVGPADCCKRNEDSGDEHAGIGERTLRREGSLIDRHIKRRYKPQHPDKNNHYALLQRGQSHGVEYQLHCCGPPDNPQQQDGR